MCHFYRTQMRQRWQRCHWNFPKSYTGALWFSEHRECNICSGACGLPELGSNCYIALTERRNTQPRVFVISEVCGAILRANIRARRRDRCLDICCQTKSDTLPKGPKKITNFARNYLSTPGLWWEVVMAVNQTQSSVKNNIDTESRAG